MFQVETLASFCMQLPVGWAWPELTVCSTLVYLILDVPERNIS